MRISVLCTNIEHPVFQQLKAWCLAQQKQGHDASLHQDKMTLLGGDLLFLVSCGQLVEAELRKKFTTCLVLHASDLPKNRGWSPHVWSILSGEHKITVTLLEAGDRVDTGDIWLKSFFDLEGHELLPEINAKLFEVELNLMNRAVREQHSIVPQVQDHLEEKALKKRSPQDSQLDPYRTIAEQFNLLRVVDNDRYPAFFDYCGHRYVMRIDKL